MDWDAHFTSSTNGITSSANDPKPAKVCLHWLRASFRARFRLYVGQPPAFVLRRKRNPRILRMRVVLLLANSFWDRDLLSSPFVCDLISK